MRLRVLFASFVANNTWSGMGRWTHSMLDAVRATGHSADAWFADDFPGVRAVGAAAVLLFPMVLALRIIRSRRRFDIVVIHEPSGFWYGVLRKLARGLPPMILMCHNVESKHFREMLGYAAKDLARIPRATRIRAPLTRYWQSDGAIRLADHVVCLSTVDREYVTRRLHVPEERVTTIINGAARPNATDPAHALSEPRVLYVGGWLDVKGRRVLPRVWRLVRERFPAARLTLVGTGVAERLVASEFDPRDRGAIAILTRVNDPAEMAHLYATHTVFLLPSLSEGSPLALLEAMASGTATVATAVGGVPDVITDGVDGLLFEPTQPETGASLVVRLLEDSATRSRLGAAARERARELTWESTARRLLETSLRCATARGTAT